MLAPGINPFVVAIFRSRRSFSAEKRIRPPPLADIPVFCYTEIQMFELTNKLR